MITLTISLSAEQKKHLATLDKQAAKDFLKTILAKGQYKKIVMENPNMDPGTSNIFDLLDIAVIK